MAVDIGELGGRVVLEDDYSSALEALASSTDEGLESFKGMSEGIDDLIGRLDAMSGDLDKLESSLGGAASAAKEMESGTREAASGANELADEEKAATVNLTDLIGGMGQFGAIAGPIFTVAAGAALAFVGAVGAGVAAIVALGQRGADVADIRDSFSRLTQEAGLTKDVLNTLRSSTDGVITDFDLMQRTNESLGAGLRLTNDQFKVVGEGARRLADDVGKDTKDAFDVLLRAMETGRVQGLRGWGIDVVALQDKIASAGEGLSKYEKQQIAVGLIMEELKGKTERAGDVTLDFGDQIAASTNFLLNLRDEVAVIVAELPALGIILDAIRRGLEAALGKDQAERAETLKKVLNGFVQFLVSATQIVVAFSETTISGFQKVIGVLFTLGEAFLSVQLKLMEAVNAVALGDPFAEQIAHLRETRDTLTSTGDAIQSGAQATLNGLQTLKGGLEEVQAGIAEAIARPQKEIEESTRAVIPIVREHAESEKERAKSLKEAAAAMKEAAVAADANRSALEALGIVTGTTVSEAMNEWNRIINQAVKEGVPLQTVLEALGPEMLKLHTAALKSGVSVELLADMMALAGVKAKELTSTSTVVNAQLKNMAPLAKTVTEQFDTQLVSVADLNEAYEFFGLNSPVQLQKAADAAEHNFEILRMSGTATTKQLKEAYEKMIDAQVAASDRLPSIWETEIVPGVKSAMETLSTAVSGSFAQMLLGVESFRDGWAEIWDSIKRTALNIFNQIAEAFIGGMLRRMIGGLASGNFAGMFSNLLGGGGLSGLLGGGATAGVIPGSTISTTLPGLGGAAGGGSGAAGGGLAALLPTLLGGAGIAAGGIGLGQLGKNLFESQTGAAAFGGLTGAAQGALIGSIVPGIGTLVGALIGGLSGAISSFFGVSKAEKAGRGQVAEFENFLHSTLTETQLLEAGNERWKATVISLRDQYMALGLSEEEALKDAERLWASSRDGGEDTKAVIDEINAKLAMETAEAAAEAGDALAEEITTGAEEAADAVSGAADDIEASFDRVRGSVNDVNTEVAIFTRSEDAIGHYGDTLSGVADELSDAADAADDLTDAIGRIPRSARFEMEMDLPDNIPTGGDGGGTDTAASSATSSAAFGEFGASAMSGLESRLDRLNANFATFAAQQPLLTSKAVRDSMRGAG